MKLILLVALLCGLVTANALVCDDSWQSCIGNDDYCIKPFCWWNPCFPRNTIEKEATQFLSDGLVRSSPDYSDLGFLFDPAVCVRVVGFQGVVFCGLQKVLGYLALPQISDLYEVTNATVHNMVQEGSTLYATVQQTLFITFSGAVIHPFNIWEMEFTSDRQIVSWTIYPDSLLISLNLQPGLDLNLNATSFCINNLNLCTGTNQQFANMTECLTFANALRVSDGPGVLGIGNSLQCRIWHLINAVNEPNIHCLHTGSQVINPVATPCTDECQYLGTC